MESAMHANTVQAQESYVALPLRAHTILGVCEGLGEDFRINPTLLRIPLAGLVLWSPLMAVAIYFALGAVVLASRLLFPRPTAVGAAAASAEADNDSAGRDLSLAA